MYFFNSNKTQFFFTHKHFITQRQEKNLNYLFFRYSMSLIIFLIYLKNEILQVFQYTYS